MSYSNWFQTHGEKHACIMQRLTQLSDDEVIEYFRFENMVEHEVDFCPLYAQNKKCHEIENLNCYLCACPYFRFDDEGLEEVEGKVRYSTCYINAKNAMQYVSDDAIHLECSNCHIPHSEAYIKKHFSRDWFAMMQECKPKNLL